MQSATNTEVATKHRTEPGIPGDLTDIILGHERACENPRIRWISAYRGDTSYKVGTERLRFRYAKADRSLGWNFPTQEAFDLEINGAWGILHRGCAEAVDAVTLETFWREHYPTAVTGFFNHLTKSWQICQPTDEQFSWASWIQSQQVDKPSAT